MSKSTATDHALSTTELLEQILSHLSIEDLFLLRRESRHWRDTMAGSPVLQRAMLLAPEPELLFEWHLQSSSSDQKWRYIQKPSGTVPEPGETVMQSSRFNPLLFERRVGIESERDNNGKQSVRLYARNNIFTASDNNMFTEMFIAQPPVTHVLVHSTIRVELHYKNGILVADIIDFLRYNDGHPFGSLRRDVLSLAVPEVMFPNIDEEKQTLIVRSHGTLADLYSLRAYDGYTF